MDDPWWNTRVSLLLSDSWNKERLWGDGESREEKEPDRPMDRYGGRNGCWCLLLRISIWVCVCSCPSFCVLSEWSERGWLRLPKPGCHLPSEPQPEPWRLKPDNYTRTPPKKEKKKMADCYLKVFSITKVTAISRATLTAWNGVWLRMFSGVAALRSIHAWLCFVLFFLFFSVQLGHKNKKNTIIDKLSSSSDNIYYRFWMNFHYMMYSCSFGRCFYQLWLIITHYGNCWDLETWWHGCNNVQWGKKQVQKNLNC